MATLAPAVLPPEIASAIVNPVAYGEWNGIKEKFRWARDNMPVGLVQAEGYMPFWAITRHEDIMTVSKDNARFLNAPKSVVLGPIAVQMLTHMITGGSPHLVRSLVTMDAPEHMDYRKLTQSWFMPKNLASLEEKIRGIARASVDAMLATGGSCDFVHQVSALYPLHVVMQILGVPHEDEPLMLKLTQEMFGGEDPDLNRARSVELTPEQVTQFVIEAVRDFEGYFMKLAADRRADPKDDVATVIANAVIDGEPISDRNAAGYYIIVAAAGHDTTSASTAGAMWALAKDPEQFAWIKADRSLLPGLIEEAIRWTTPVQHFMRTAAEDCEIGGQRIAKDDWLMLCYVSGNHDERVFPDPDRFDASRGPNRHVAFGAGVHQCLGLHLARLEMRILFDELLDRIDSVELAGTPQRASSTFVGGPKTLPIRFVPS
ncbi:MAG: cytochrome [Sphingomonadales bacterium RIFCSPHIGHO2_01_FULL_65_20]|uniref:cytochrome P450 n=1 Tax=Blastomonas sp. TaxID=1909299 RepID=UPI0008D40FBA|nr:cytochrome P450 [Blastomonas sp.]MCH2236848.1 cytochrome P450 [Blastomonas sp.]OHC91916.1 MAG: cytochrome [Sphingomonadales bacterium RIFCSPHIGHO2_01_FULL_65_20]